MGRLLYTGSEIGVVKSVTAWLPRAGNRLSARTTERMATAATMRYLALRGRRFSPASRISGV
jgi:hypothetical protein